MEGGELMSTSTDDRIVNMKMDNRSLLSGVKTSLSALASLNKGLSNAGHDKGMSGLSSAVDDVTHKFSTMKTVALGALLSIGAKLANAGINVAKSWLIDPVSEGFKNYEEQINAAKIILANTQQAGTSMKQVNQQLQVLQLYAQRTVYNMGEMSHAVGVFTAAGVGLKPAVNAIQGIANLGAMTGASSAQVSSAFTQMSQAISSGTVRLQDWNSFVQEGVANGALQKVLAESAVAMGNLSSKAVKFVGPMQKVMINGQNFRNAMQVKPGQKSWLSGDAFTLALDIMSGKMTKADLVAKGFATNQIGAIMKIAKTAQESATQVKTVTQLFSSLKEEIGGSYAMIFKTLIGGLHPATKILSAIHNTLDNAQLAMFETINKVLKAWVKLGGKTQLILGIQDIWKSLGDIFHAVGKAWDEAFPGGGASIATTLTTISRNFMMLASALTPSKKTLGEITDIFRGLFSVLHIAGDIIGIVFHAFGDLFGLFQSQGTGGGILSLVASLGRLLTALDQFVSGNVVTGATAGIDKFFNKLRSLGPGVKQIAGEIGDGLKAIADYVKGLISSVHVSGDGLDKAFGALLAGGIFVVIRKFFKSLTALTDNASGILKSIKGVFGGLRETLETYQKNIKADTLLKIAGAVGILAASMLVLSNIPAAKLAKGLGGVSALLAELVGALKLLDHVNKSFSLVLMATSLDLLAVAILGLSAAVLAFGSMDPKTVAKGLTEIAATIGVMVGAMQLLSRWGKSIILSSVSIGLLAVSLDLLAGSILIFSRISFETLGKGLLEMAAALVTVGLAMKVMGGVGMLVQAAALDLIAAGLVVLAGAMKVMGSMSWESIGKAMTVLAGSLVILGLALYGFEGAVVGALALALVVPTLLALAVAMKMMGGMNWSSIGKGLVVLAASLTILLIAAAAAEAVAPGLLALGAAIVLLGVGVLAAGVGIGVMAAGLALLGSVGVAAIAVLVDAIKAFIKLLPSIATAGADAFTAFLVECGKNAPKIADAFVKIVRSALKMMDKLIPQFEHTANLFIGALLHTVDRNAPKFGHTITVLVNTGLGVLKRGIPRYVDTGIAILQGILDGIKRHLPKLISTAGDIVVEFIHGMDKNQQKIIDAGTDFLVHFLHGIGKNSLKIINAAGQTILTFLDGVDQAVNKYEPRIIAEGVKIGKDILSGIPKGLADSTGLGSIASAAQHAASIAMGAFKGLGGFAINSPSKKTMEVGRSVQEGLVMGIAHAGGLSDIARASSNLAVTSIGATKRALDSHSPSKKFFGIGLDVGKGFVNGILASLDAVRAAGIKMASDAVDTVSKTATAAQMRADAMRAKADGLRAAAAERRAQESKKNSKARNKELENEAKALEHQAHLAQQSANQQQKAINQARNKAAADRRFKNADEQGKADILNNRARSAALAAEKDREKAIKLAAEADAIRAKDAKRAAKLEKQAKEALQAAEKAAKAAKQNAADAAIHATNAVVKSAADVAKQISDDQEAARVAAMTDAEKVDYYTAQAKAQQAISDAKYADAAEKLDKAKKEAATNAKQAQKDVATAQQDVLDAEAAKQAADQAASDAASAAGSSGSSSTSTVDPSQVNMPSVTIASAQVYGAQNMFDAYAKAALATQQAAEGGAPSIQYVQNNYSPEALSPTEVYRQSKNLLSNAERKLVGARP